MKEPFFTIGEMMQLSWEYDPDYELVRGHVNEAEALQALQSYYGEDVVKRVAVEHAYARCIPDTTGEYDFKVVFCKKGPGAFEVTICKDVKR